MGFVLIHNGRPLGSDNIKWKFAGRDGEFESTPERLERNIAFWRNKLGIAAEVEYLNVKLENKETYAEPIPAEPAIESISESNDSIVAEESSLPQSVEDSVDTPRKKSRRKAS